MFTRADLTDPSAAEEIRPGDWFLTYSGKKFYPLDPKPEEIFVEDIAHSLANICRFGGHTREFYSVAQHCVIVSYHCLTPFEGLMHDSPETYIGDMVRPLKYSIPQYRQIEDVIWQAICERFKMPVKLCRSVKEADNRLLMTERRDVCMQWGHKWSMEEMFPPFEKIIKPWSPVRAEREFLKRFAELGGNSK